MLDPGSFRDPSGHVYEQGGRIFRTVAPGAAEEYGFLRSEGLLERFVEGGWMVDCDEVEASSLGDIGAQASYVVEHPRHPFISYPYEWTFPLLKAAALFHLDFHLEVLSRGVTLSDASAYNIQFRGTRPIFIDLLSLRRYRENEFWLGHRQFCEQFLNPLLLRAVSGVPHNAWYRGNLEGIGTAELVRLLPFRKKLQWKTLSHLVLPVRLQSSASGREAPSSVKARKFPRPAFEGMLRQLRKWIAGLEPADTGATVWGDYETTNTYAGEEEAAKRTFVAGFAEHVKPTLMLDMGCNTGRYSEAALEAGAGMVVGFDFDQAALEKAFARSAARNLDFLPLFLDAANPSPDQGWNGAERQALHRRVRADALVALAFEHHLTIGRNIPTEAFVEWLTGLAPVGVVEFVPKGDPTVQRMLALREDIFADYGEANFVTALERRARIVRAETVTASGRRLFWFDRT